MATGTPVEAHMHVHLSAHTCMCTVSTNVQTTLSHAGLGVPWPGRAPGPVAAFPTQGQRRLQARWRVSAPSPRKSRGSLGSTRQLPLSPQPSAAAAPAEWGGKANDEQLRQEVLHAEHRGAQEDPRLARAV